MLALALKGKCKSNTVDFSRFAAIPHRNSYTHYYLRFFKNIYRGLLQYCLYKASVSFTIVFASWSNYSLQVTCTFRTKCTLVQAFNIQKCKFASSIVCLDLCYVLFCFLHYKRLDVILCFCTLTSVIALTAQMLTNYIYVKKNYESCHGPRFYLIFL